MDALVYVLCAATSAGCAILLLRNYFRNRARLLFWSGLCFACFAISNILLFLDWIIFPDGDLSVYRTTATFAGLALLLYGLIWETS